MSLTPSLGSAVEHLAIEVTHQLQAVLGGYSGLCSLDLATYSPGLSAEGLASLVDFPHIRSLEVHADSISSLELVHTLTHLEELTIEYGTLLDEQKAPDFPSRNFSNLTSLTVDTEWEEPSDTFLYLSQLQALRHLSLCTAALNDFNFAALSLLTSLHMDNFQLENLEALQGLPQLMQLDLLGHPSDADIFMLANLTKLTALEVEMLNVAGAKCHLSSVVMLSSLVHLESLQCDLVDNGAQYGVYIVNDPADADTARMVVSIPDAPFCFALC